MKKYSLQKLLCFFFLFSFFGNGYSQNDRIVQKKKNLEVKNSTEIISQGNLRTYSTLLNTNYKKAHRFALEIAEEKGWPLSFINSNGELHSLVRLNSFGMPIYQVSDNLDAARTTSTDDVWSGGSLGLSLDGSGLTLDISGVTYSRIGMWEVGIPRLDHQETVGRAVQRDGAGGTPSTHANHVMGTMIASGVNSEAKGMAYNADLLDAFNSDNDNSEMALAASRGMLVSNHSYGVPSGWEFTDFGSGQGWYWLGTTSISETEDPTFGRYNDEMRDWDNVVYNAPYYLPVKSAGNEREEDGPAPGGDHFVFEPGTGWVNSTTTRDPDGGANGYDCLNSPSSAKNILTVGAVNAIPGGYSAPSNVVMSSFSSWGPTDDGRIKPDIVGNGVGVFSSTADGTDTYESLQGTSMSSPNVAGSLVLLQEHYEDLHGAGNFMRNATLRGLVIHTADEAGTAIGPDYRFGWGLLNTATSAQLISDAHAGTDAIMIENTLLDTESISYDIQATGTDPLIVTICWTDPAGTPVPLALNDPTKMLVNDLDALLTNTSTMATTDPYILDPANPANNATTGDNNTDNVEKIYIGSPTATTYTLDISHKGSLTNGHQNFSLIVSGGNLTGDLPPTVASPLATVTVDEGAPNQTIDLTGLFTDVDNDDNLIVETIASNTNSTLVTPTISGNDLTLDFATTGLGVAYITIRGTSNGKFVDALLTVNVLGEPVETLYDQSSNVLTAVTTGVPAMQRTNEMDSQILLNADDFEVPNGEEWVIRNVSVEGFNNEGSEMPDVRVYIYEDDGTGQPGTQVYDSDVIAHQVAPTNYDFSIDLPTNPSFGPGVYWISVLSVDEFIGIDTDGDGTNDSFDGWYWTLGENPVQGNPAYVTENEDPTTPITEPWQDIDTRYGLTDAGIDAFNLLFSITGSRIYTSPTALDATEVSKDEFRANWEALPNVDGYRLDVSSDNFATLIVDNEAIASTETSFMVTGLTPATEYQYRVRFVDPDGSSENSNIIMVTTCDDPTSAASNIAIDNGPLLGMFISWDVASVENYMVLVKEGADFETSDYPVNDTRYNADTEFGAGEQIGSAYVVYNGSAPEVTVTNLLEDQTYYITVIANNCYKPQYNLVGLESVDNVVTNLEQDLLNSSLKLYPNPVQDNVRIMIENSNFETAHITIYNNVGVLVKEKAISQVKEGELYVDFDLRDVSSGMYFVEVKTERGTVTKKLIVE